MIYTTKYLAKSVELTILETIINVSIHEYNYGALILEKTLQPQLTIWSNNYATNTIWFCEEIVKRWINLFKIDTVDKLGDIFTKLLKKVNFEHIRNKSMGWYISSVSSFVVTVGRQLKARSLSFIQFLVTRRVLKFTNPYVHQPSLQASKASKLHIRLQPKVHHENRSAANSAPF